jgi:hypothetical protein
VLESGGLVREHDAKQQFKEISGSLVETVLDHPSKFSDIGSMLSSSARLAKWS